MTHFNDPILLNLETYCRSLKKVPNGIVAYQHLNRVWEQYTHKSRNSTYFHLVYSGAQAMAGYQQYNFASLSLTVNDEAKLNKWIEAENVKPLQVIEQLLERGYKVSVTWVIDSSAFCVSVIGTKDARNNKNTIMTSWSDDLEQAIIMAGYKHFVLCNDDEWPSRDEATRWG